MSLNFQSKVGFIQFMSTSIYIAGNMKNTVLETLLIDYSREKSSKMEHLIIRMLAKKYENNPKPPDVKYYNLVKLYLMHNHANICKELLYK